MLQALNEAQRTKAILRSTKTDNDNLAQAFKDNVVLDYAGVRAADCSAPGRQQLSDLVDLYVGNMDEDHARVKMDEVKRHIDRTWFAWIGGADSTSVYYYRVHSPVILIEFDHQKPANLRQFVKDPNMPVRSHIHCVVPAGGGGLAVAEAPPGSVIGVGTEIHLVKRLNDETPDKTVVSLDPLICPCSTMFRVDAAHLAWVLEGLVAGEVRNRITVDEETASWARVALERMLATV